MSQLFENEPINVLNKVKHHSIVIKTDVKLKIISQTVDKSKLNQSLPKAIKDRLNVMKSVSLNRIIEDIEYDCKFIEEFKYLIKLAIDYPKRG